MLPATTRCFRKLTGSRGTVKMMSTGTSGEGAGHGGGTGGSIRDAGGSFGKMQVAREEEYFYKAQKMQLEKLKADLQKEIDSHKKQLESHKKTLSKHQQRLAEIEAEERALGQE